MPTAGTNQTIAHAMRDFQREYALEIARSASVEKMLAGDAAAVNLIFDCPACSPTHLAKYLALSAGGVTTLVDRLITRGYATRTPRAADRRSSEVTLTDLGSALSVRLRRNVDDAMSSSIGKAEERKIVAFLDRARTRIAAA